ncbi:MAG: VWA domain-containing protein [Methanosarcinales archaeon]
MTNKDWEEELDKIDVEDIVIQRETEREKKKKPPKKKGTWMLIAGVLVILAVVAAVAFSGIFKPLESKEDVGGKEEVTATPTMPITAPETITKDITMVYSSEKRDWLEDATNSFNNQDYVVNGIVVKVKLIPMGSGESMEKIVKGDLKPELWSPASSAWIKLLNKEYEEKYGKVLVHETGKYAWKSLVRSPVVLVMWKSYAEDISKHFGVPENEIGWNEIFKLTGDPKEQKWWSEKYGGRFKYGHTHPLLSNSGLLAVLAEAYSANEITKDITSAQIKSDKSTKFMKDIESGTVFYGRSTGFYMEKSMKGGPNFVHAFVSYENLVIENYNTAKTKYPNTGGIIASYPHDGTFWSDHPAAILDGDWVDDWEKQACRVYIDYLLNTEDAQQKANKYGFRSSVNPYQTKSPIDSAHGVTPSLPKAIMEVPSGLLITDIQDAWKTTKKHTDAFIVIDTSGSMKGDKIMQVKIAAKAFLDSLESKDRVGLITYSDKVVIHSNLVYATSENVKSLKTKIDDLTVGGGTALRDSAEKAIELMDKQGDDTKIKSIVFLSDGIDTASLSDVKEWRTNIIADSERINVNFYTIAYGKDADLQTMTQLADDTNGKFYNSPKSEDIKRIYEDVRTFL